MGGTPLGARTPDDAAAALGMALDDLKPLVDSGILRVLPLAGGGWLTTDSAINDAARVLNGAVAVQRRRGGRRSRGAAPRTPAVVASRSAMPAATAPPAAAPPAPHRPPVDTTPRVPRDTRRDVQPNPRLDMREAAQLLHLDERSVLALARDGKLRATQLGREWVTTARDVRTYMRAAR